MKCYFKCFPKYPCEFFFKIRINFIYGHFHVNQYIEQRSISAFDNYDAKNYENRNYREKTLRRVYRDIAASNFVENSNAFEPKTEKIRKLGQYVCIIVALLT